MAPSDADESNGVRTMARSREPWNIRPAKKSATFTASIKSEVEAKAKDLIENVLKPKHVLPPQKDQQLNYITDITAKWFRNNFYFVLTYACPAPGRPFTYVRVEVCTEWNPLAPASFALYAMRYTRQGKWVGVLDALSVDECMAAIRENEVVRVVNVSQSQLRPCSSAM